MAETSRAVRVVEPAQGPGQGAGRAEAPQVAAKPKASIERDVLRTVLYLIVVCSALGAVTGGSNDKASYCFGLITISLAGLACSARD